MKIITLVENLVNKPNLMAEHGLCLYIETTNRKILFDTGQTGLFMQNAKTLGIDIEEIDTIVISHGHNDHTGGLYPFLKKNKKAKIICKPDLFAQKYSGRNRFIGTKFHEAQLKDRLIFVDDITELDENLFIFPDIQIHDPLDTNFKGFNFKKDNTYSPDEFNDELFMVAKQKSQINIITACSHRGITNICTTAREHFGLPVGLILGGFHMKDSSIEQYVHITHYFRAIQPKSIGVCHCTGIEKYAEMHHECETHLFYNFTGNEVMIS
jgi:7,8-dihydropterin-6-yl-methyl-4-(beta-D-ribofuranosyl)aminobenzene 5'-phosphate synthase